MIKTFKIITLGCKVNSYESQAIREMLLKEGFEESDNPYFAIVNTCAVTQVAEHKSRQKVSSLAKKYNAKVIVCGCSSQLHYEKYSSIPGVIGVIGNNNHNDILNIINEFNDEIIVRVDKNTRIRKFQNLNICSFDEKVRAFVKIGDGCNNYCAYCIIPTTRGNLRSRNKDEILCEIKRLIEHGYKEVVLTGIDMSSYGLEFENYRFNDLLKDIINIDGLRRLRISSIEASYIDDEFINILKSSKVIAPHLHIPLQSGSNSVLQRMRRKYTCEEFYQRINKIHQELPYVALACDVIVGFPGETLEEFNETYDFIKKCEFSFLHVFPYSVREGTLAAVMPNQVNDKIKKERVNKLIELGNYLTDIYKSKINGQEVEVLVENYDDKRKLYHGLSENYLDVFIASDEDITNEIVKTIYLK